MSGQEQTNPETRPQITRQISSNKSIETHKISEKFQVVNSNPQDHSSHLKSGSKSFSTVIIGGGPAGSGVLMKAMKDGVLKKFLDEGVALVEQSDNLLKGSLTDYQVNSDTLSNVFLECLEGQASKYLNLSLLEKEVQHIKEFHNDSIPLRMVEPLLSKIGEQLNKIINENANSQVFLSTKVIEIKICDDGTFQLQLSTNRYIRARNIIIACGGKPFVEHLDDRKKEKSLHSHYILEGKKNAFISKNLRLNSKVAILGGSHSAFSVAHYLLSNFPSFFHKESSISIWARELPKIYFPSIEDAINSGYSNFSSRDVCQITGRLFRLAGLRMDGRDLYIKMLGLGGATIEKRVTINTIEQNKDLYKHDLESSSLIIQATGYVFNMPVFLNSEGERIEFKGERSKHWVNEKSQLIQKDGTPIENAFGVGLASGFIPQDGLGGEESFYGQTNGLWYYQNLLADLILNQLSNAYPASMP